MRPGAISGLRDPSPFIDFGVQFSLSEERLSRFPSPWASISGLLRLLAMRLQVGLN